MSKVTVPATPLSRSSGSFGDHVEKPSALSRSDGSFDHKVAAPRQPGASSTVNGTTFVVPASERESK